MIPWLFVLKNLNINREVSKRFATIQESQKVLVRRIEVLLLADIEKLKEDVACLTKHNVDLKHDFVEIKGVNTFFFLKLCLRKKSEA